jgi:general secretion pathway protein K
MRTHPPADIAQNKDGGFVLLAVLLVALILVASATALTHFVRGRIGLISAASRSAEAEALADAGFNLAILDLEEASRNPLKARRFPIGETAKSCAAPDGQGTITIAVRDEAGKINLNSRNEALLLAFFTGMGLRADAAQPLLDRLLDYRDADNITRNGDPETALELVSAAGPGGARYKNRPFDVIEELAQVPGFPPPVFSTAQTYLTVYSDIDGFDPSFSPPGLRAIIASSARSAEISNFEKAFASSSTADGIPRPFIARSMQRALAIVATGAVPSGARFTREAIVKVSASGSGGYVVRRWLQAPYVITPQADDALPPC